MHREHGVALLPGVAWATSASSPDMRRPVPLEYVLPWPRRHDVGLEVPGKQRVGGNSAELRVMGRSWGGSLGGL